MKRTIYVIRDSLTGKYYTSASCDVESYDESNGKVYGGDFKDAVLHNTLPSVREGVKSRVRSWKRRFEQFDPQTHRYPSKYEKWHRFQFEEAMKRIDLPACGMEIVAIELNSDGNVVPLSN
jgi:hypothetical protein